MNFKLFLFIIGLIVVSQATNLRYDEGQVPKVFYGKADNWQQYGNPGDNGIFIKIDINMLNLKEIPEVFTSLTGGSGSWVTTGTSNVYQLTKTGFKVFLRATDFYSLTPKWAADQKFVLHYQVVSNDPL